MVVEINSGGVEKCPEEIKTPKKISTAPPLAKIEDFDKIIALKSSESETRVEIINEEKISKEKSFSLHRVLCCLRTRRTS